MVFYGKMPGHSAKIFQLWYKNGGGNPFPRVTALSVKMATIFGSQFLPRTAEIFSMRICTTIPVFYQILTPITKFRILLERPIIQYVPPQNWNNCHLLDNDKLFLRSNDNYLFLSDNRVCHKIPNNADEVNDYERPHS